MAKRFAVLGSPIAHSKSPTIHMAAYKFLGLDWQYSALEMKTPGLSSFLQESDLDGASLTMPLKDEAFAMVSVDDPMALIAKSVNTIFRTPYGWQGFNTDVFGLVAALKGLKFQHVLVLGSGATARNAVLALRELNPEVEVEVRGRNVSKTAGVVDFAIANRVQAKVGAEPSDLSRFDLTISTLPPGSDLGVWFENSARGTLLDVAYNPWPSALAVRWASDGGNVVSGLEMLIWQAIAQIRVFSTGSVAEPLENEQEIAAVMRNAAEG